MKNLKYLILIFIFIINSNLVQSQSGVQSHAYGKTVFWKVSLADNNKANKNYGPSGVYSPAIGETVFIVNDRHSEVKTFLLNPPTVLFNNLNLIWGRLNQDQSMPGLKEFYPNFDGALSGYELLRYDTQMDNENIYELFSSVTFGSYVKATDIRLGTILWEVPFNLTVQENTEVDNRLYLRSDGNIEITGSRLLSNSIPNIFPFGIAIRKTINKDNGLLLNRAYKSFADGGLFSANQNGQFGSTLPIDQDSKYVSVDSYVTNNANSMLITRSMDQTGLALDTISIINSPASGAFSTLYLGKLNVLPDGGYVIAANTVVDPLDPTKNYPELIFLDKDGKFSNRINLSPYISGPYQLDVKVERDDIFVNSIIYDQPQDVNTYHNFLLVLDQNGNVKINLKNFKSLDGEDCRDIKLAKYKDDKYVATSSDGNHCLKYFIINADGSARHVKTACATDTLWEICPTEILHSSISGNITIGCRWVSKLDPDREIYESTFAFDVTELGETSSSDDKVALSNVRLFPNPVSDYLNIEGISNGVNVNIRSIQGHLLHAQELSNSQINVSNLPDGMYILDIYNNTVRYNQKFVIMK